MKRHLHFNCFSGAGGDMILAALVDLGADADAIGREFVNLGIGVAGIGFTDVMRGGMRGRFLGISETAADGGPDGCHTHGHSRDHGHTHVHGHSHGHSHDHTTYGPNRHLEDLLNIVGSCRTAPRAKERAVRALRLLAEAEGRVHGKPPEAVHFHEISGIDTIVDVLGSCLALEMLGIGSVSASRVTVGRGMVRCAHGTFTVPAPATLEILAHARIPYEQGERDGEFLTPTGAALLAAVVGEFGSSPVFCPERTGYGAGLNDYEGHANLLQATMGGLV